MSSRTARTPRRLLGVLGVTALLAALSVPLTRGLPAHADTGCAVPSTEVSTAASWGQARMGADRVWQLTTGAVTVAVIDTGVSAATPSLAGAVLPGMTSTGQRGDEDCFGRGTFVASLIAARAQEGTPFVGVAPGATILPVRLTNTPEDALGSQHLPRLIGQGIAAAITAGARVVAIPLTTAVDAPEIRAAVDQAAQADVLVIASAHTPSSDAAAFPAALDGVLAVAPIAPDGSASAEELGAAPDLASPAVELVGASPAGAGHIVGSDPGIGVGYVAGAAALVRERFPELSAQQVADRLRATADRAATASASGESADPATGWGVVDPVAAVTRLDDPSPVSGPVLSHLELPAPVPPDHRTLIVGSLVAVAAVIVTMFVIGPLLAASARRRETVRTTTTTTTAATTSARLSGADVRPSMARTGPAPRRRT